MGHVPKAALLVGGRPVLDWQVSALREAGIEDIAVVVGPYRTQMDALIRRCEVREVRAVPQDAAAGTDLVASQHAALQSHVRHHPGKDLLLLLGDLPCVRSTHVRALRDAWAARPHGVLALVPVVAGVRGHPVLLEWAAAHAMAQSPVGTGGVRGWMSSHPQSVQLLECTDPAHTQDLDTPEDLRRIGECIERAERPGP